MIYNDKFVVDIMEGAEAFGAPSFLRYDLILPVITMSTF
jgi:type 1 glutamine amidotransferase